MKTILAARASSILYDLLASRRAARPFLLPANVCPIVPLTFLKAGVPFEFVDISWDTLAMDLEEAHDRLHSRAYPFGGLLYVHTYGDPATPDDFFAAIKRESPELLVIDDRCLCPPDLAPDPASQADVILYSTGYAKIVDLGFGGYAFLRDELPYEHRELPFAPAELDALEAGYKHGICAGEPYRYRDSDWLDTTLPQKPWPEFAAAVQAGLELSLEHRRALNAIYDACLPAALALPAVYQLWRYNIRVPDGARTLAAIHQSGHFASRHYASLAGLFGPGWGTRAATLASQVVNLFNDHHFTPEMAERTAQAVIGSL